MDSYSHLLTDTLIGWLWANHSFWITSLYDTNLQPLWQQPRI